MKVEAMKAIWKMSPFEAQTFWNFEWSW